MCFSRISGLEEEEKILCSSLRFTSFHSLSVKADLWPVHFTLRNNFVNLVFVEANIFKQVKHTLRLNVCQCTVLKYCDL